MKREMISVNYSFGNDFDYHSYLARLSSSFKELAEREPLFTTIGRGYSQLCDAYLSGFSASDRQYYNCNTCLRFIEQFGGLVTIKEDGSLRSALWNTPPDGDHRNSVKKMLGIIERQSVVTGVFLTGDRILGTPMCGVRNKGLPSMPGNKWRHLSVEMPESKVHSSLAVTAGQAMAEKGQEFENVWRAVTEVHLETLRNTVALLEMYALYRSDKVLGPSKWLLELVEKFRAAPAGRRDNIIWRAVAMAPAGFCHPRSSVWWSLLEDMRTGRADWAAERFRAKMSSLQYQRPQAVPTIGAIDAAEKLVDRMGIRSSLERRYARLDEIEAIWASKVKHSDGAGVFDSIRPSAAERIQYMGAVTWHKFKRVLPTASEISINIPSNGNFCALLTAEHDDAPPILQWDNEERRNPFSWYLYQNGSYASSWGLAPGEWLRVPAVSLLPSRWRGGMSSDNGALFIIDGCAEKLSPGNGLFPEILKSELHGVRSVIEAYSKRTKALGKDRASACGLLMTDKSPVRVRVKTAGVTYEYVIDRWE